MPSQDHEEWMDEADVTWVNSFLSAEGGEITPQCVIEGFVAVIAYTDENGIPRYRPYNCLQRPLDSVIGLLSVVQMDYYHKQREDQING